MVGCKEGVCSRLEEITEDGKNITRDDCCDL